MARVIDIIKGLQILAKYAEEDAHIGGAEHDVIYGPPTMGEISPEDREKLRESRWHEGEDEDEGLGWYHFA